MSRMGEKRGVYKILVEKCEENGPLETFTFRREDSINPITQN